MFSVPALKAALPFVCFSCTLLCDVQEQLFDLTADGQVGVCACLNVGV